MGTRTITGTVQKMDGTPWEKGVVKFRYVASFVTAGTVQPKDEKSKVLDANGYFSITLIMPDTGTVDVEITTPDNATKNVNLAAGPDTDLQTILASQDAPVDQNAIQTVIDAANLTTIRTVTGATSVVAGDQVIRCNGTFAVTLPAATGSRRAYLVRNIGTGVVTVTRAGSDLINGGSTVVLTQYQAVSLLDVAAGVWDA
jgi:hypothetical protein